MASIENLLQSQQSNFHSIHRFMENFKKLGKARMTETVVRGRLAILHGHWERCVSTNTSIIEISTQENRDSLSYFKENEFATAEDSYLDSVDELNHLLDTVPSDNAAAAPPESRSDTGPVSHALRLPQIELPKFTGDYTEWESFRDLFQSLVADNEHITNVQKLHYLKTSVTGDASRLFRNLAVTAANYHSAWADLKARYENKRILINAHLNAFLSLPAMTRESSAELTTIRDTTHEALSGLRNLDRPVDQWDDLLVFLIAQKFEKHTRKAWESHIGNSTENPTYNCLSEFLDTRIRILETISFTSQPPLKRTTIEPPRTRTTPVRSYQASAPPAKCPICNALHKLVECDQFLSLSIPDRINKARASKRCLNCLKKGHRAVDCQHNGSCRHCNKRHNTLLHLESRTPNAKTVVSRDPSPQPARSDASDFVVSHATSFDTWRKVPVLLATAVVNLVTGAGNSLRVRALLDQGAECTFISESVAQLLRLTRRRVNVPISVMDEKICSIAKASVELSVSPRDVPKPLIAFSVLVLPRLTSYKPPRAASVTKLAHLARLKLADPDPTSSESIDIVFGADIYGHILTGEIRKGNFGEPVAQNTVFGWIISGPTSNTDKQTRTLTAHCASLPDIDSALRRFWELEECPRDIPLTDEELQCEKHFCATHTRAPSGRYIVRLPFTSDPASFLGNSREIAENHLRRMESRLKTDAELAAEYRKFMEEYSSLHHMRPVTATEAPRCFIPHHPVVRQSSSTTRVRVVFNASCRTSSGVSLNDTLSAGPKLQLDLSLILMRWRLYKYVFTADIQKMYRQIDVHPKDTALQSILWRNKPSEPITAFELTTVTYGTACAPYLALRVLRQLAEDDGDRFPLGRQILNHEVYVDDILSGANSIEETKAKRDQVTDLLNRGLFKLRKWSANDRSILADLPSADCALDRDQPFSEDDHLKILGLTWSPKSDAFSFRMHLLPTAHSSQTTKREVLSTIARLFDPLGWLAPVIVASKILMQELWLQQLDWDAELPEELQTRWRTYCDNLSLIPEITIPRWIGLTGDIAGVEIHGFADASSRAYAAVVYVRVVRDNLHAKVHLIGAKTKVAPIKQQSIPRLELCAALLLARLLSKIADNLGLSGTPRHAWTDSTIVLAWLRQHASTWATFVANRVSETQALLPRCSWHHVPTASNPADCASRGLTVSELRDHPLWWTGPKWLSLPSANWPASPPASTPDAIETERRITLSSHNCSTERTTWSLADRISSWPRLLRVTALCMLYIDRLKKLPKSSSGAVLSSTDVNRARLYWIQQAQAADFHREIDNLKQGRPIGWRPLAKLSPFLDPQNLPRVGGRLGQSCLSHDEQHPMILPKHRISELITANAHLRCLHGGTQLTLRVLRQHFWIIGARNMVKAHIHRCVACARERHAKPSQIMADLPRARITPSRPFTHCGVDYAGPLVIRLSRGRNPRTTKAYIAVFICFATRAAHLEAVTDYSSAAFLAAFRRFASRRGLPAVVYSDNGTTFRGADKEIRSAFAGITRDPEVASILAADQVAWSFIPPTAPHFGGLWEAGVKSVKHHLKRVVGAHTLSYEELSTLLCQIEGCLNSRSIAPMTDDPASYTPLTPGHFLIGAPLAALPEPSDLSSSENRLTRYQLIQRLSDQFWKRWTVEYLHGLQQRHRWFRERPNIRIGDLVLLRSDQLPPSKWQLGRIIERHPGRDSHTRVVTVRTAASTFKRPISQICVLPVRATQGAEL